LSENQVYRYGRASALDAPSGALELATCGGVSLLARTRHPQFFTGFLTRPYVAAAGLVAVARVAGASYVRRSAGPSLDPVVTSNGDRLRFESFSSCGGAQARFDLLAGALDGELLDRGTTNVDVNEPLRRMLARVAPNDTLHLSVGPNELAVITPAEVAVERKVALPTRWLRGFAEVQQIVSSFDPRLELDAIEGARFLSGVGKSVSGWVVQSGRSLRLTSRAVPGSVFLANSDRLQELVPLLRHGTALRAYGPPVAPGTSSAPSAWEVQLPDARFTVALSPESGRGFSGEGATLRALASDEVVDDADTLRALLNFEPRLDLDVLGEQAGLGRERVRAAVACLAASGQVGYDAAEASYFHRELPYDAQAVETLSPRLRNARDLITNGAVRLVSGDVAEVVSGDALHRVRMRADGSTACTCRWWTTHQGSRGPCKHEIAVSIARAEGHRISQ